MIIRCSTIIQTGSRLDDKAQSKEGVSHQHMLKVTKFLVIFPQKPKFDKHTT